MASGALLDVLLRLRNGPPLLKVSSYCELKYAGSLGADGADVLAQALTATHSVTELVLPNQRVGVRGAEHIAMTLRAPNASITYLDLCSNAVMDAGAVAVADALRVNGRVQCLLLTANRIGDEGAAAFAELLCVNWGLTRLGLAQNCISQSGKRLLKRARSNRRRELRLLL